MQAAGLGTGRGAGVDARASGGAPALDELAGKIAGALEPKIKTLLLEEIRGLLSAEPGGHLHTLVEDVVQQAQAAERPHPGPRTAGAGGGRDTSPPSTVDQILAALAPGK
jgi:hypothetical protein